jgi:hypothetical protein
MNACVNAISNCRSLRLPQRDSLEILSCGWLLRAQSDRSVAGVNEKGIRLLRIRRPDSQDIPVAKKANDMSNNNRRNKDRRHVVVPCVPRAARIAEQQRRDPLCPGLTSCRPFRARKANGIAGTTRADALSGNAERYYEFGADIAL